MVTGVPAQQAERGVHAHRKPLREEPFRLLDHDPAVERALQLLGDELMTGYRALVQDPDGGGIG
jgi:hypothetical protein